MANYLSKSPPGKLGLDFVTENCTTPQDKKFVTWNSLWPPGLLPFFFEFPSFFSLQGIPCFLEFFLLTFFPKHWGSERIRNPCLWGVSPCLFQKKKQGKEDQGGAPERGYIRMFPGTKNRKEGTRGCSPVLESSAHGWSRPFSEQIPSELRVPSKFRADSDQIRGKFRASIPNSLFPCHSVQQISLVSWHTSPWGETDHARN